MPKHVLVVDDDKENANLGVTAIHKFSGGALTAEAVYGGQMCLDRLGQKPLPDLILLDLNMPDVSGADVIRALVKHNPLPGLKILVTTMWGRDWIPHWNLTDIHQTKAFKELIVGTCDKGLTMKEMVGLSLRILGLSVEHAA